MKRSLFNIFTLLVLLGLVLSACGPSAATTEAPMEEAPAAPAATEAPAEPAAPAATEAPAMVEKTVTVGFTSSLTGAQENNSKRQVNGFQLWMDQTNEAGGVSLSDGTVVKFAAQTYDDESNTERVQELYTRLITEDNADFLISPYSSGLTSAASIVAEQNGKVMITTGAADNVTYETGNTSLFQLYTPANLYMSSTVDMLQQLDPEAKIALVHEDDKFSTGVVQGIKPYLAERNFEVVLEDSYNAASTTDFGPLVNKIIASGATVLLGGGHYEDGTNFARALYERKAGLKFAFLLVAPADNKFAELGDAAVGIAVSSQWELAATHTEQEAANLGVEWFGPNGQDFADAYMAAYGDGPTYHVAGGYTAGLLQKAIIDADSVDPEAVKAALNAMNIMTFYGGIKFDTSEAAHGLQIAHKMVVAQWQKNDAGELQRVIIAPADVATADPLYPIPAP